MSERPVGQPLLQPLQLAFYLFFWPLDLLLLRLCSARDQGGYHCSGFSCEVWASVVVEHGLSCHEYWIFPDQGSSPVSYIRRQIPTTKSPEKACLFSNVFSLSALELITCSLIVILFDQNSENLVFEAYFWEIMKTSLIVTVVGFNHELILK